MDTRQGKPILFVGSFNRHKPGSTQVSLELAQRLMGVSWSVTCVSYQQKRLPKLLDTLFTIFVRRRDYQLALLDVFSGPSFYLAYLSGRWLQLLEKPYGLVLHGGNLPLYAHQHPKPVRSLLQTARFVVAPSPYLKNQLSDIHQEILVIPNPVDLHQYRFRAIDHAEPRLVWLRAFHAIYNPGLAVEVVWQLHDLFPTIQLSMIGPDKGDGSFQRTELLVNSQALDRYVRFMGPVHKQDVPQAMALGDIFLNTANVDNAPVSVIEAMACGLCIVSTQVGGIPDLLEHEVNALLVPPGDPGAMAAAVQRILVEPGLASRLSHNARKKAEQFNWPVILPQWETLFQATMDGVATVQKHETGMP